MVEPVLPYHEPWTRPESSKIRDLGYKHKWRLEVWLIMYNMKRVRTVLCVFKSIQPGEIENFPIWQEKQVTGTCLYAKDNAKTPFMGRVSEDWSDPNWGLAKCAENVNVTKFIKKIVNAMLALLFLRTKKAHILLVFLDVQSKLSQIGIDSRRLTAWHLRRN